MEREKKKQRAAIMIQKWIRGYRTRINIIQVKSFASESTQLYAEFRQRMLSAQGITVKVFSKTHGNSHRRALHIDKKREFLWYKPSLLSGARKMPLNSIYKVAPALSQTFKEAPEHPEWCLSVHTPAKIVDIEALDEHEYRVLLTGFTRLEALLHRKGAFYVDEHGCVRRSGKSVLPETSFAIMSCAEQARMKDAKRALKEYYESQSKARLRARPGAAATTTKGAGKAASRAKSSVIMANGKAVQTLASAPVRVAKPQPQATTHSHAEESDENDEDDEDDEDDELDEDEDDEQGDESEEDKEDEKEESSSSEEGSSNGDESSDSEGSDSGESSSGESSANEDD